MSSPSRLQVMSVSLVSLGRMSFNWYLRKCTCTRIISLSYRQSRCSHRGRGGCLAAAAGFRSLGPGCSETSHEARSWRPRGLHLDHHRDQPTTLRPARRLWHVNSLYTAVTQVFRPPGSFQTRSRLRWHEESLFLEHGPIPVPAVRLCCGTICRDTSHVTAALHHRCCTGMCCPF